MDQSVVLMGNIHVCVCMRNYLIPWAMFVCTSSTCDLWREDPRGVVCSRRRRRERERETMLTTSVAYLFDWSNEIVTRRERWWSVPQSKGNTGWVNGWISFFFRNTLGGRWQDTFEIFDQFERHPYIIKDNLFWSVWAPLLLVNITGETITGS